MTSSEDQSAIQVFFSESGPLSKVIPHYHQRDGQVKMAQQLSVYLNQNHHMMVEAGTGIGKSFAYLVPALLNRTLRYPLVVSTGTIALQEQLVNKDIPMLSRCFDRPIKVAIAKGRGNYLCENRFEKVADQLDCVAENEEDLRTLHKLSSMVRRSPVISRSNLTGPLTDFAWTQINSETGLCGPQCKDSPCSYLRARKEMYQADLIVINHTLLFIHLNMAKSGVSLLPAFKQLILDEAHHCPSIATELFGINISNSRIKFMLDRIYSRKLNKGFLARLKNPEPTLIRRKVDDIRQNYETFFSGLRYWRLGSGSENGRLVQPEPFSDPLSPQMTELADLLENWAGSADNDDEEREFRYHAARARSVVAEIDAFIRQSMGEAAYWVELARENSRFPIVSARAAPLDVSTPVREMLFNSMESVVMTSATLSVAGSFDYFSARMGADQIDTMSIASPFDYRNNVGLVSFKQMVPPNDPEFTQSVMQKVRHCIDLTSGGAFVLVTSYDLLKKLHAELDLYAREKGYPLYAQGLSGSRSHILDAFRSNRKGILIGNHSFWEGVDVPGPALRNVIITRLPFEVPSHPLKEAQYEMVEKRGGSSFKELALPQAMIRFKQGFGRLVRRMQDKGLVCVLDSRLHSKSYGKHFLKTLPLCRSYVDCDPEPEFLQELQGNE